MMIHNFDRHKKHYRVQHIRNIFVCKPVNPGLTSFCDVRIYMLVLHKTTIHAHLRVDLILDVTSCV